MPTEDTTDQTTEQPTNEQPPAQPEESVESLRARVANAERERDGARRESEGAQAYLQNLLGTLRTAAERPGGAPVEERSLAERLAENPEGVLDEHFKQRMGPIYNAYLENQDLQNRELARERILRDDKLQDADGTSFWNKYEKEINDFMAGMPLEVRARPGAYERALKFVMAEHIEEVSDAKAARIAKQREARERGAF